MINLIKKFIDNIFNPVIDSSILLPSKDHTGKDLPKEYIYPILLEIASTFGGYTIRRSVDGGFITSDNTLIEESVIEVIIIGKKRQVKEFILSLAVNVKESQSQESVLIYIQQTPLFI